MAKLSFAKKNERSKKFAKGWEEKVQSVTLTVLQLITGTKKREEEEKG